MRPFADVRASDADRDRALAALRRHFTLGRLDPGELERRCGRAARAATRRELRVLLADLPLDVRERAAAAVRSADRVLLRVHAGAFGTVNAGLVGAWAVEGAHAFWPAVVVVPWGAALGGHAWSSRALRRVLARHAAPRRLAP